MKPILSILLLILLNAPICHANTPPLDPAHFNRPVRVACIGDSITYGAGATPGMSYPSQLQNLLGAQWVVGNFGVSARTLLRKGDFPWWNEPAFREAQAFNPDAVIIMLGTNDTKPQNWKHKDEFYSDYSDLVDLFAGLPSRPQIYVCRPCPVPEPGSWGINETNIKLEIAMIDRLAAEKNLGLIDMHAALAGRTELLPDRVHPNTEGALVMAETVYTALTGKGLPPRVNSYFADHAVLQRGVDCPVGGTAADGEIVTVEFAGQKVSAVAVNGRWKAVLKPMAANAEPQTMTISNGEGTRVISDVLVGDVWIASGQSNMERQLGPRRGQQDIVGWKKAAAAADYPLIRQYQIPQKTSMVPLDDGYGKWIVCSPDTAADFCGVGYFFIRDIHETQKVPLALIHSTWGGTVAEAWTSLEQLKTVEAYAALAKQVEKLAKNPAAVQNMRQTWLRENDKGTMNAWWAESLTASGWEEIDAPASFEKMGIRKFDGVVWLRREFELPAEAAGQPATLALEKIDDCDTTWLNGKLIGETDGWEKKRTYQVPEGILKPGRNVISIRMLDAGGGGGWAAGSGELKLLCGTETVSLSGTWQQQVGTPLTADAGFYIRGRLNQNSPAMLFNAMIYPLLTQPIKGAIWYQGESNNGRAKEYRPLFAAMIRDWRTRWKQSDFPFLFVQIAPHNAMTPELRESQRLVLEDVANTAMTVTVDVGDAADIHPTRKGPVGQRLALAARALAYGEEIEYSGPLFESMKVDGEKAVIRFTHTGTGLTAKSGELRGFEMAGADGRFVPAKATIDGDTVVVTSGQVKTPAVVRYGWANVPDVNLFNNEGLPASPFRSQLR